MSDLPNSLEGASLRQSMIEIRKWGDEQLVNELRNPTRATLGFQNGRYHLLLCEAVARLLERRAL